MTKHFRLALVVFAYVLNFARAEEDENRAPPTEIPDFSNLDEYVYEPKSTLTLSMRRLTGVKTKFSGGGILQSLNNPGAATGSNFARTYADGGVGVDGRVSNRVDSGGSPIIDPGSGSAISDPIAPDGKTNTWSYTNATQALPGSLLAFHDYTAAVIDPTVRAKDSTSASGVEVSVSRDMGKIFGTRMTWSLIAGVSLNDIYASTTDHVQATISTLTDLYSLDGQVAPPVPYTAPSSVSTNILDGNGNSLLNTDGSTQTTVSDTTVLLGNQPVDRSVKDAVDNTSVSNRWKVHGSYLTFRGGPVVYIPLFNHLRASFSAGPAVFYAGSDYTVTQTYITELGTTIANESTTSVSHLLTGYFADASLEFDLTDRAGFFAGAAFQASGSYSQKIDTDTEHYVTRIDLGNQQGLRAGMTIKF